MKTADNDDCQGQKWNDQVLKCSEGQPNQGRNVTSGLEQTHDISGHVDEEK